MRALTCMLVLVASASADCILSGTVVDSATGKVLAGTRVFARPIGDLNVVDILHVADEHGAFCFARLERGDYELVAARGGYVLSVYGARSSGNLGTPFAVPAQTAYPPVVIRMTAAGAISGTVHDSSGQPLAGASVDLLRKTWQHGWTMSRLETEESDGSSSFQFSPLGPGTYYLRVTPPQWNGLSVGYLNENGQPVRPTEAPTFYGGSFSLSQATPILLEAGQEISNLGLIVNRAEPRHISGRASAVEPGGHPVLQIFVPGSGFMEEVPLSATGTFLAQNLLPAKYNLHLEGVRSVIWKEVDVTGGDVDGVVLEPIPQFELRISLKPGGPAPPPPLYLLNLETAVSYGAAESGGGSYLFRVLQPARYLLKAQSDSVFVQSLIVDGKPTADAVLDLRQGMPGNVLAVLGSGMAHVEVHVERPEGDGDPMAITLAWEDMAASAAEVEGGREMMPQNGVLKLPPLAPGKYRLFAIQGFDYELWGSPELAAALAEKSVEVELRPGESRIIKVTPITADEWTAALRKVGM
jgi:hypothetical protein